MEKNRGSGWALAGMAAASVLLLLAGYTGAYCYLVKPRGWLIDKGGPVLSTTRPEYPSGWQQQCERLFAPVHQLDRVLRPQIWREKLIPEEIVIQFNHN